jgi:hypothetical protein
VHYVWRFPEHFDAPLGIGRYTATVNIPGHGEPAGIVTWAFEETIRPDG